MKSFLLPGLTALLLAAAAVVRADYPIVSHRYLADPGAMVWNGRVYLYCSNDDENPVEGGYVMKSLVCVSSADLKNWTDHGVVFRVPADAAWAANSWAPAAIERDGRFYLYFANNASGIGVATGPTPVGPFTDARGNALITAATPGAAGPNMWLFDPAVFIDDDRQAYLYFGGNGISNARVIRLNDDMISTSGSAVTIDTPNFFEASWLHKRNGVYYLSYSSNPASGLTIDYLTSTNPMTGFTYRGTVAGQPPSNNNNNHQAIFALNGQWYHAYHNRAVATQAGIPTTYRRNLGIERLDYNADGSIQPVTYTADGLTQLAPVNPYIRQEAEMTNAQSGIETEPSTAGGMDVRFTRDGAWFRVRGVDFGAAGAATFTASVASPAAGGTLEVRLGSVTGPLAGACAIPASGDQAWIDVSCPVSGATALQDVYFTLNGGGSASASAAFDWWRFDPATPVILAEPSDRVVLPGAAARLTVDAAGADNRYQWFHGGTPLAGQTAATLTLERVTAADAGEYHAAVTTGSTTTSTRAAAVTVDPDASRLINLSCRTDLKTGQMVSPGFFIAGAGSKPVLIRVAGPALADFGLSGVMPDPQLHVFHGTTEIAQNDNWDPAAIGDAFVRVGAFGFTPGSRDAALLTTLPAGQSYTVQVTGVAGSQGIVLLEVYDADVANPGARLTNVSVRGNAGVDAASLVLGFVLRGSGARPLLIRGAGPALTSFGVTDALPDPLLRLYDASSSLQVANSGWSSETPAALATAADAVGAFAFPPDSRDAAVLRVLTPGQYTVQVTSFANATGEALAEAYEVP